jgi:MSHA pilin protein MshC
MVNYFKNNAYVSPLTVLNMKQNTGFTLIELVIVIVILAILSVTVAPKFFSSNGFSEYAYRTDVIAKLRLIQTRAMQQANDNCHQVMITSKKLGKTKCTIPAKFFEETERRATLVEIETIDNVVFSASESVFQFSRLGRPLINKEPKKIDITITGEQALIVRIESEGYIHAL